MLRIKITLIIIIIIRITTITTATTIILNFTLQIKSMIFFNSNSIFFKFINNYINNNDNNNISDINNNIKHV